MGFGNFVSVDVFSLGDTLKITVGATAGSIVLRDKPFIIQNTTSDIAYLTFNGDTATTDMFELRENERITVRCNVLGYIAGTGTTLKYTEILNS